MAPALVRAQRRKAGASFLASPYGPLPILVAGLFAAGPLRLTQRSTRSLPPSAWKRPSPHRCQGSKTRCGRLNAEGPILKSEPRRLARLGPGSRCPARRAPAFLTTALKGRTATLRCRSERPAPLPLRRLDQALVLLLINPRAQLMAAGDVRSAALVRVARQMARARAERPIPRGPKSRRRAKAFRLRTQTREAGFNR